jgi:hypothetical protein
MITRSLATGLVVVAAAVPATAAASPYIDMRSADAQDSARTVERIHAGLPAITPVDNGGGGVDWAEAGLGAAAALGLAGVAGGAALLHYRRPRRSQLPG